jgi:hypothetical protein
MAKMVLLDVRLFASGVDLSGSGNKVEIGEEFETKQVTNWRSGGAREVLGGLASVDITCEGQMEQGVDEQIWANRRVLEPWTAGPTEASDTAAGNLMYLTRALRTRSTFLGEVGEVSPWSSAAKGSWPLVRGQSAHPSGTARTATGDGTSLELGAVADGEHLYANLHVLSISGTATPTITVDIESDDDTGFASATVQESFTAMTAVGGQSIRIPGPITDDWWRVAWTISGTNPSFLFLVSLGIE